MLPGAGDADHAGVMRGGDQRRQRPHGGAALDRRALREWSERAAFERASDTGAPRRRSVDDRLSTNTLLAIICAVVVVLLALIVFQHLP